MVDCITIDGLTLRDTVLRDKRLHDADTSAVRFGKTYYRNLKRKFRQKMQQGEGLPHGVPPCESLMSAFVESCRTPPQRQPLRDWVTVADQMSEGDIICCCRALMECSPTSSREQLGTMIALAQALFRCGAHDRFPKHIAVVFDFLDRALVQALYPSLCLSLSSLACLFQSAGKTLGLGGPKDDPKKKKLEPTKTLGIP